MTLQIEKGAVCFNSAKTLEQMDCSERLALERSAAKTEHLFKKIFPTGDFIRYLPLDAPLKMRLIPAKIEKIDSEMILRSMHCEMAEGEPLGLSEEEEREILEHANKIEDQPPSLLGSPPMRIRQKEAYFLSKSLWYEKKGAPITDQSDLDLPKNESLSFSGQCKVFCPSVILEKQRIASRSLHEVVANYAPYAEEHLMIAPKRHIEKIGNQTDAEIEEKWQCAIRISKLFSAKRIIMITRNGWRSGQTQPHLHDHIVGYDPKKPQGWMKRGLTNASTLSQEDFDALRIKYSSYLT